MTLVLAWGPSCDLGGSVTTDDTQGAGIPGTLPAEVMSYHIDDRSPSHNSVLHDKPQNNVQAILGLGASKF